MDRLHDPALHVEHAGPGGTTVADGERARRERADREHRVVVADEQHPRGAAAGPVDVRTRRARHELRRPAEASLDHGGERLCGTGDRVDVERGRLDAHQRGEVVEHGVEIGHADHSAWHARRGGRSSGDRRLMDRRAELGEFLRARRAAMHPADVGLPAGVHRRTPGLRREEVAMLAGVSVTWYTWLEQGRRINASRDVLDALARALHLDPAEHDHLLVLADAAHPAAAVPPGPVDAPDALVRLIASMAPAPAYVLGPRWEFARVEPGAGSPVPGDRAPRRDRAQPAVGRVRRTAGAAPDRRLGGPGAADHGRVPRRHRGAARRPGGRRDRRRRSPSAAPSSPQWWPQQDVAQFQTRLRRYRHERAGDLVFEYQMLMPSEWPNLKVVCQLPVPGDDSAHRLDAWHDVV